ncbi:MAG: hypothetical protein JWO53_570, partial [Chlamydiia bacterium]|nr:hypothetical protein [Chlamydiia bacterium]
EDIDPALLLAASSPLLLNKNIAPLPTTTLYESIYTPFRDNLPRIFGSLSAVCCTIGVSKMYGLHQTLDPRLLSFAIASAEYGLKGVSAFLGFTLEKWLYARKDNPHLASIHKTLAKLEGIGIGFANYGHQVLPTNIQAFTMSLPIGFFLGVSTSRMQRINEVEDMILARNSEILSPRTERQENKITTYNKKSILYHVTTTLAFEAIGLYIHFKGGEEAKGLDVFFSLTPLVYYATRFGFSKKPTIENASTLQRIGHFALHKSPQVLSEELNYWLSFVLANAIAKTDTNARIFYIGQSILFGSIEGALFTIDGQEDEAADAGLETTLSRRQKILHKLRAATTRNYARMDILIKNLAINFKPN